jgi:hypothetical protein
VAWSPPTTAMLLYDRIAGQADVVGFDAAGKTNLDFTNSGWRGSWDVIVAVSIGVQI